MCTHTYGCVSVLSLIAHSYCIVFPQALFQIALAVLECNKRQLLEASDEGEAMCCLNEFMANISNKDHVTGKSYDENMVCVVIM